MIPVMTHLTATPIAHASAMMATPAIRWTAPPIARPMETAAEAMTLPSAQTMMRSASTSIGAKPLKRHMQAMVRSLAQYRPLHTTWKVISKAQYMIVSLSSSNTHVRTSKTILRSVIPKVDYPTPMATQQATNAAFVVAIAEEQCEVLCTWDGSDAYFSDDCSAADRAAIEGDAHDRRLRIRR